MSTHELKPGDRVRVTAHHPPAVYHPGDRGTVVSGPHAFPTGNGNYYLGTMDKDAPSHTAATLGADEIEPDV
jgi:hypothetical protein